MSAVATDQPISPLFWVPSQGQEGEWDFCVTRIPSPPRLCSHSFPGLGLKNPNPLQFCERFCVVTWSQKENGPLGGLGTAGVPTPGPTVLPRIPPPSHLWQPRPPWPLCPWEGAGGLRPLGLGAFPTPTRQPIVGFPPGAQHRKFLTLCASVLRQSRAPSDSRSTYLITLPQKHRSVNMAPSSQRNECLLPGRKDARKPPLWRLGGL